MIYCAISAFFVRKDLWEKEMVEQREGQIKPNGDKGKKRGINQVGGHMREKRKAAERRGEAGA